MDDDSGSVWILCGWLGRYSELHYLTICSQPRCLDSFPVNLVAIDHAVHVTALFVVPIARHFILNAPCKVLVYAQHLNNLRKSDLLILPHCVSRGSSGMLSSVYMSIPLMLMWLHRLRCFRNSISSLKGKFYLNLIRRIDSVTRAFSHFHVLFIDVHVPACVQRIRNMSQAIRLTRTSYLCASW